MDEAFFKKLERKKTSERPLLLVSVDAYVDTPKVRKLYTGTLPHQLQVGMTRKEIRKHLGKPHDGDDEVPFDSWLLDGRELIVGYNASLQLGHLKVELRPSLALEPAP